MSLQDSLTVSMPRRLGQLLRHVNTHMGMTIMLVTHSEELASIADNRYVLKEGKVFGAQL